MRRIAAIALLACFLTSSLAGFVIEDERIILILRRGDANNDGTVDQSDAIFINDYLYLGGQEPPCLNQADANNDGWVDVSDSVYLLTWLFVGGSEPPAPGPYNTVCAHDDEPNPGCEVSPCE